MEKTRSKAAGVLAATLAAGGIASGLLFTPAVSGAQDDTSTTSTTEASSSDDAGARRAEHQAEREERADGLAEVLGITTDELRAARDDGQTIAEIAEANGVALETVTDHLITEATERLEERIAELPEHVDDLVNGELPARGERFGPGRGGNHGPPPAEPGAEVPNGSDDGSNGGGLNGGG